MSTVADNVGTESANVEAGNGKTRKRKRSRVNYLEAIEVKKLSRVPSVPDEFDPERYTLPKETDFEDSLHFYQFLVQYHTYFVNKATDKAERLEAMDTSQRNTWSQADKTVETLLRELKGMSADGLDVSELFAKVETGLKEM